MPSTAAPLGSAALSMRFEVIMEDITTPRITHRDKTSIYMRQAGYCAGYGRCNSGFAGGLCGG